MPKTDPETRKKIIKKLYKKVAKIITVKGTYVGHIVKEDQSGITMITPEGLVVIKPGEIGMRLPPGDSKVLLK